VIATRGIAAASRRNCCWIHCSDRCCDERTVYCRP